MSAPFGFDRHAAVITAELTPPWRQTTPAPDPGARLAVTLSRQSGCGAHVVAERLVEYLDNHAPATPDPWTVYDRNLVQCVIEDHHLPNYLERFMPEDRVSEIADVIHELLGTRPTSSSLAMQTAETIYRLAERGNVILIGRGANIVTSRLKHVFHVRLVGSLRRRVAHVREVRGVGKHEAMDVILKEDRGRHQYLRKYFNEDPDDPTLYHLTINTDLVSYDDAARMIGEAMITHRARTADI